jgi:hypothetical protein
MLRACLTTHTTVILLLSAPQTGRVYMRVSKFEMLSAGAAELDAARFTLPDPKRDCVGPRGETLVLPRVGSAFEMPHRDLLETGGDQGDPPAWQASTAPHRASFW